MIRLNSIGFVLLVSFLIQIAFVTKSSGQELTIFGQGMATNYYEDDRKISKKDFVSKIESFPESAAHWKKAKSNILIASSIFIVSGAGLVWGASKDEGESKVAPAIVTFSTFIIGAIIAARGRKNERDAVLSYNKDKTVGSFVSPSNNGIGLTLHF